MSKLFLNHPFPVCDLEQGKEKELFKCYNALSVKIMIDLSTIVHLLFPSAGFCLKRKLESTHIGI